MESLQVRQELSLIRSMIEKTRRDATASGRFFVVIGLITLAAMAVIDVLARYRADRLIMPVMLSLIVINGIISYIIIEREKKREKIITYAKTLYLNIWAVCGLSILLTGFLFPLTHVYSYDLVPLMVSILMGIAVFSTGIVFEKRYVQWCGSIWWAGSVILAYTSPGKSHMYIFMALVLLGWVMPGMILNYGYNPDKSDES